MQGFWPDGIYSAPCDEGLRYDIEAAKSMGLNMLRKHIKVEPDRSAYTNFAFSTLFNHSCCSLDPSTHPPTAPTHVFAHWLARFVHSTHSTRLLHLFVLLLIHSFLLLLIHSFLLLLICSLPHSLARSLTHSLTHQLRQDSCVGICCCEHPAGYSEALFPSFLPLPYVVICMTQLTGLVVLPSYQQVFSRPVTTCHGVKH